MSPAWLQVGLIFMDFLNIFQSQFCPVSQYREIRETFSGMRLAGETSTLNDSSKLECATACLKNSCKSFGMDMENSRCYLYDFHVCFDGRVVVNKLFTYYWLHEGNCPESYTFNSNANFCYNLKLKQLSWSVAMSDCIQDGGLLAVVDSKDKYAIVKQLDRVVFLGAKDVHKNSWWKWANGGRIENWTPDQPDNHQAREHCLEFTNIHPSGFNDLDCDKSLSYICEIPMI